MAPMAIFTERQLLEAGLAVRNCLGLLRVTWLEALEPMFARAVLKQLDQVLEAFPVLGSVERHCKGANLVELSKDLEILQSICRECVARQEDLRAYDEWLRSPTIRHRLMSRIGDQCVKLKTAVGEAISELHPAPPRPESPAADTPTPAPPAEVLEPPPAEPPADAAEVVGTRRKKKKKAYVVKKKKQRAEARDEELALEAGDEGTALAFVPNMSPPRGEYRMRGPIKAHCPPRGPSPCEWCLSRPAKRAELDVALTAFNNWEVLWESPSSRTFARCDPLFTQCRTALELLFPVSDEDNAIHNHCDPTPADLYALCERQYARALGNYGSPEARFSSIDWLLELATPSQDIGEEHRGALSNAEALLQEAKTAGFSDDGFHLVASSLGASTELVATHGLAGHPSVRAVVAEALVWRSLGGRADPIAQSMSTVPITDGASNLALRMAIRIRQTDELRLQHPLPEVQLAKHNAHVLRLQPAPTRGCWSFEEALDGAGILFLEYRRCYLGLSTHFVTGAERIIAAYVETLAELARLMRSRIERCAEPGPDQDSWSEFDKYQLLRFLEGMPKARRTPPLPLEVPRDLEVCMHQLLDNMAGSSSEAVVSVMEQWVALSRAIGADLERVFDHACAILQFQEDLVARALRQRAAQRAQRRAIASAQTPVPDTAAVLVHNSLPQQSVAELSGEQEMLRNMRRAFQQRSTAAISSFGIPALRVGTDPFSYLRD